MNKNYLQLNIFGMSLGDMATNSKGHNERVLSAYINYLYKIEWDEDLKFIPVDHKDEFLELKKLLVDEVNEMVLKGRKNLKQSHNELNIHLTAQKLDDFCNTRTVIRNMHWTKAKHISNLIKSIFFGLLQSS